MSYRIYINSIEDIRDTFDEMLEDESFVVDKTGVKTVDIPTVQFIADEPTIFGKPNPEYVEKEIRWYLSKSLSVNDIELPIPKIWQQVSSVAGEINSNYGWCIFSFDNGSQYESCKNQLQENPDTRRAIMIYTRPSMQTEFNRDGMSDFICTNTVQYFIRENQLISYVSMRSCDGIFGYSSDWGWQRYIQNQLLNDLKETYPDLELGPVIWNVGSFHIYERHFYLIEYYRETGNWNVDKLEAKKYIESRRS